MTTTRRTFLAEAALGGVAIACCSLQAADEPKLDPAARKKLDEILADKDIWGAGFGKVLTSTPTMTAAGVNKIQILRSEVVSTPLKTQAEAEEVVKKIASVRLPQKFEPRVAVASAHTVANPMTPPLKPQVLPAFTDDGLPRVVFREGETRYLKEGLTVAAVERKHGKPEKTTTVAISSERDSRPLILTTHEYASGAIAFVESDAAPKPGLVDRVVLATAAAAAATFEEK